MRDEVWGNVCVGVEDGHACVAPNTWLKTCWMEG